jgi:hypothetical protein
LLILNVRHHEEVYSLKRPQAHVNEDKSEDILKKYIPVEWIMRKIPKDYGIDYEIEIVENEEVTGKRIWIQLKSVENPIKVKSKEIIINGESSCIEYISYQTPVNLLKYSLSCDFPLILAVVDLTNELIYWIPLQDEITMNLEDKKPTWRDQDTVVIHIPYRNNLVDDQELNGLKWYSLEPARMRAFAIIQTYYHELQYSTRFSGYEIDDGYIDYEEELLKSAKMAKKFLTLTLEQDSLFGHKGIDIYIGLTKPMILDGIDACTRIIDTINTHTTTWAETSLLIGKVSHAVNLLSTCIAMYQNFRKDFLL